MSGPASRAKPELWKLLTGLLLVLCFFRLEVIHPYEAHYGRIVPGFGTLKFHSVAVGEFLLFLGWWALLLPGLLLVWSGMGAAGRAALSQIRWDPSQRRGLLLYGVFVALIASFGHHAVLLDLPIADDELNIDYAARIWNTGALTAPAPPLFDAWDLQFFHLREGRVTSLDFPGVIAVAAAHVALGMSHFGYALLAGVAAIAFVDALRRVANPHTARIGAVLWLLSPTALTHSFTAHGQLLSRCWILLALWSLTVVYDEPHRKRGYLWLGTFVGVGFCTRAPEVGMIMAPTAVWLVLRALRSRTTASAPAEGVVPWRGVLLTGAALLPWLVLFAIYNHIVTGIWYLPPRVSPHVHEGKIATFDVWHRVGGNVGFNLWMLVMWTAGPATLLAATVSRAALPVRLALAGVGAAFLIALAHDNTGIHPTGPIHYSEATAVAAWITAYAVGRLSRPLRSYATPYAIALLVLDLFLVRSLGRQAEYQYAPRAAVEAAQLDNAIVLARRPAAWGMVTGDGPGTWAFTFPKPRPDLSDPVLFATWVTPVDRLRETFPDRRLYRLYVGQWPDLPFAIVPLDDLDPEGDGFWREPEPPANDVLRAALSASAQPGAATPTP